jgi:hypothetical protein
MELITGDKFKDIAKWIYVPQNNRSSDDYDNLQNTLDWVLLKDNDIVYTHTHYVKQLFEELKTKKKYIILVSHNSDVNIDRSFEIPQNIVRWFSQNVNQTNPRLSSIPIGLENTRWLKQINKHDIIIQYFDKKISEYKNWVYLNHNISTNVHERLPIYLQYEGLPWVTSRRGKNGKDFQDYAYNIHAHRFVICPNGNGIDTHRMWEVLYAGSIPIVKRGINTEFYKELPVCFVDAWDEITLPFLQGEFKRIKEQKWNMRKLDFQYWNRLINGI